MGIPIRSYSPNAAVIQPERRSRGLSLIEVLIALLVLSIGLVGMAALHLNSLQGTHSSYYRSIASSIALDLEERLWLELGDRPIFAGCLSEADVDDVIDQLQTHWRGSEAVSVFIPEVNVDREGDVQIDPGEQWTEVPIRVSWTERRFDEDLSLEVFRYTARIICGLPSPPVAG